MIRNIANDIKENPQDYVILSLGAAAGVASVGGLVWLLVFGA